MIRGRISRADLLDAARGLLDGGDYRDLTVDALARSLQMSKSTLYKHFPGKDDVVISLIDDVCERTERALGTDPRLVDGVPSAALEALIDIYAAHADRLPRAVLVQRAKLPRPCRRRLAQTDEVLAGACRDVLNSGFRAGVFRTSSEPALAATAFTAAIIAAIEASARGDVGVAPSTSVRQTVALLLPGLLAAA